MMKYCTSNSKKCILAAVFILIIVLIITAIFVAVQVKEKEKAEMQRIENEYNGEFADDSVTVLTTKARKELNKEYTFKEFSEVKLVSIENLNVKNEEGDFLVLYLKNPSKQNVLKAVYKLKNNPIVIHSELNGIEHID